MKDIIEEMGLTLGEVIGAALVFSSVAVAIRLFSEYGHKFIELLVG